MPLAIRSTPKNRNSTVGVYWNSKLIKRVSLYGSTTTRRSVIAITTFPSIRRGTLTIRTLTNNQAVQIDGVGLLRTWTVGGTSMGRFGDSEA